MADLPNPLIYIFAKESFGSGEQVGVTILPGEVVLRGLEGSKKVWLLNWVDRAKGICTFSDRDSGGFLGLPTISVEMDNVVRRLQETQEWTAKETGEGSFSISRVLNNKELFWHLDNEGGKVRIAPSSQGIQSWVFTSV